LHDPYPATELEAVSGVMLSHGTIDNGTLSTSSAVKIIAPEWLSGWHTSQRTPESGDNWRPLHCL